MSYWGVGRILGTQNVAYTGTAGTISTAIGLGVQKVRVYCTTDAFIKIAVNPTATTSDAPMPAGSPEYFSCMPGEKVSAIQSSANGTLYVTEIA